MALLAVAPLFLFPYCGAVWTVRALLWLSFSVAVWMIAEPSRRREEMPHEARARVMTAVVTDPLFWLSLLLIVIAVVRWMNGGVGMAYDAETAVWSLTPPGLPFLPGGTDDAGALPFATMVAVAVLMQAARHALGKSARVCFLYSAAFLAGGAAVSAMIACLEGHRTALALAACPMTDATFAGSAFGLFLMGSMIALVGSFERKWMRALPLLFVAVGGCGLGLYLFSPDYVTVVFGVGTVLTLVMSLVYAHRRIGGLVVPKCLVFLLLAAIPPVLLVMGAVPPELTAGKFAFLTQEGVKFVPEGFLEAREALSAIAARVWHEHPWLGTGLGSFALDIRFGASESDWALFPSAQVGALNGWWQFLAERGITGALLFLAPLGFMLWTYLMRATAAVKDMLDGSHAATQVLSIHPVCYLGVFAIAVTAVSAFVDHSFWRPEVTMAVAAMFAMAGSAFPVARQQTEEGSETEK